MSADIQPAVAQADPEPCWSIEERRKLLRELIVHEDKLTTERIQALYTLQGFLFASFGLLSGKGFPLALESKVMVSILAVTGLTAALFYLQELQFNTYAIAGILTEWDELKKKCGNSNPPTIIGFAATERRSGPRWMPRRSIPLLFMCVWTSALILAWWRDVVPQ